MYILINTTTDIIPTHVRIQLRAKVSGQR